MRILQVIAGADQGGAETFFVSLVLALQRAGLDQQVVMRHNPGRAAPLRAAGLEPVECRFGQWFDWHTKATLKRAVADFRPDIALTWMNRASKYMPAGNFLKLARLGGYYDLKYYRACDHLFCNTKGIVAHVVNHGWPAARAHYMPNFASIEPAPPVPRDGLDTPADAPLLLAMGRLHRAKAFDTLLRALASEPRAYLWLAGEGPLRDELEALAHELGVMPRVRFLGWRDDRAALIGAADICLVPSRYEPLGNVCLEAWAAGRPLVAAASAGPSELITDGADGLLVPIDDAAALAQAITRVIDGPGLPERLVAGGARRYEEGFSETACVKRYLDTFKRLLQARV
ncbi:MAG: glycosyltransferase [Pseudomonadota bacterium]